MVAKAVSPAVGQSAHMVRQTFKGTINGVQTWSTSLWFQYSGSPAAPSAADVAAGMTSSSDLEGFVDVLWAALSEYMAPNTIMQTWTVDVYGEDPATPASATAQTPFAVAGSGQPHLPPECALVASLKTGRGGASFRGRMYLPLLALQVSNQGQASDVAATDVATAVAAYLTSVNGHDFEGGGAIGYELLAAVNSVQLGLSTPITSVQVDTRIDAQRRREDKLPGAIHSHTV